ncbi:hypothetical protein Asera_01150 [Actinocatenispora sera]|uniref:Uncharacterized protein n=1 Tax=Actinocatenispora sera TaxID=390989 RepID=A0A810KT60_9ACTN|nr:hypothetical protein Asera_01150 [Actinocatenispora sera]
MRAQREQGEQAGEDREADHPPGFHDAGVGAGTDNVGDRGHRRDEGRGGGDAGEHPTGGERRAPSDPSTVNCHSQKANASSQKKQEQGGELRHTAAGTEPVRAVQRTKLTRRLSVLTDNVVVCPRNLPNPAAVRTTPYTICGESGTICVPIWAT